MPSFKPVLARLGIGGSGTADAKPRGDARGVPGITHAVPTPAAQPGAPLPAPRARNDAAPPQRPAPPPQPEHAANRAANRTANRTENRAAAHPDADVARRQQNTDRLRTLRPRPATQDTGPSPGVFANAAAHVQAAATELSTPFGQYSSTHRPLAAKQYRTDVERHAPDTKAAHAEALRRRAGKRVGAALGGALPAVPEDDHEDADERSTRLDALEHPESLDRLVKAWFPEPAGAPPVEGGESSVLTGQLAGLGAPEHAPATQRGALLAIALRGAGAHDAADAKAIVEAMRTLDFSQMDRATSAQPAGAAQPLDATRARAWLAARILSRSDEGFDSLCTLRGTDPREAPMKTAAQRVMLQAADHADPGPHDTLTRDNDPAPGAVRERMQVPGAEPTLAARAFEAAAAANTGEVRDMTPAQKGDFFAWRQNFREDGAGTPLAKTRERLHKFTGKTLDRAAENRWKTFAARAVGKHRSPVAALRSGTADVTRPTIAKELKALKAVAEHRGALMDQPMMQPRATLAHAHAPHSLVELAALHVWFEHGGFPTGKPDAAQMKQIVAKANSLRDDLARTDLSDSPADAEARDKLLADTASWGGKEAQKHEAFTALNQAPFNLERITNWAQRADVEDAEFVAALDTLRGDAKNLPHTVAKPQRQEVVKAMSQVVRELPSGARLRMQDGNRFGASTRGLSANVGKLLNVHGVPLSPRVDLRATGNRTAMVELGRSNYGAEIFMGTAKSISTQAGLGVRVGYDFDVGLSYVRAGVTAQAVLHQHERNEPSGVSLRVTRRVKEDGSNFDDKTLEKKYAAVFDHLVESSAQAKTGTAGDTWNRLADKFIEDPDISVGWTDGIDDTTRRGASVDVGVYGGIPHSPLTAGFGLGVGYASTRDHTREVHDDGGSLQIEQHRSGGGSQWVARLTGGLSGSVPVGHKPHTVGVGVSSLDTPSANLALSDSGVESRVQIARDNGVLMPRSCIIDVEYKSTKTFTHAVDMQRGAWRDLYALDHFKKNRIDIDQATPEQWDAAHQAADRKIDTLLGDIRGNAAPNQTYFHRFRLRNDAARKIDALAAADAAMGKPSAAAARKIDEIMTDPASWIASDLKVKESNATTTRVGLNAAIHLSSVTQVSGEHEIVSESADFAQLDKLERYQARLAAAQPAAPVPAPLPDPAALPRQRPPVPTRPVPPTPPRMQQRMQAMLDPTTAQARQTRPTIGAMLDGRNRPAREALFEPAARPPRAAQPQAQAIRPAPAQTGLQTEFQNFGALGGRPAVPPPPARPPVPPPRETALDPIPAADTRVAFQSFGALAEAAPPTPTRDTAAPVPAPAHTTAPAPQAETPYIDEDGDEFFDARETLEETPAPAAAPRA
ncbi:awr type III effector family protein [Burkholderia gladioli]|uniref:Awr type III effector family protein n=1 Tax=Burkholderia gladioli TaxID=28095 RepID=A0AAW3EYQ4_BURGA|nr:hypothetical protein [Burkholderia gladioli]AJW95135.1 awr type III effector family protein [Burkholderia gladioli]ASD83261.1 autotransporter [Burkholderia gladioli pv. gladioli]AWY50690.1 autotransporter [Burkholderia gladioli pv. gladioli]KGC13738.1 awr type III effector family protein [Burkholderia gladioli]SPV01710.1 putative awr type III effector family protein [Burkholderia gladioli]